MLEIDVQCGVMGRNKQFPERKTLTLPEGTAERIETVLRPGEDAMDLIREGLFKELDFREMVEAEVNRRLKEKLLKRSK